MNRPYRDNEERQAQTAMKSLDHAMIEIAAGYPDEALALAKRAVQEILVLLDKIDTFDRGESDE